GRSTCHLIESCSINRAIELCSIDTWEGGIEHDAGHMRDVERRFDHNIAIALQRAKHPVHVEKLKKRSSRALVELIARQANFFDFIYIDGSHQAPDVLTDSVLAFQLLRVGGIMVWDDYLWSLEPQGRQDVLNMPKMAIDSFINNFQRKLRIVPGPPIYQLYVQKTAL
ncbi:MAG: class I SAM-dependent methyltransferase, partial [Hyphomicrobiales bacterium]|nr:class I SAM-dependent methyltransferase [Hyphomicrobiales bacterium]